FLGHAVAAVSGFSIDAVRSGLAPASSALFKVSSISGLVVLGVILLALFRRRVLRGPISTSEGTWDCGYARPAASMQYTASSFAQPLTAMFGTILRIRSHQPSFLKGGGPAGDSGDPGVFFPEGAAFESHSEDFFLKSLYGPIFKAVEKVALMLRFLQSGRVQLYILYIALTLFVLLIWCLR
ncbi:MAG: hypothetical protein P4L55_20125, partial [Syntrophobacteraceae bacterium]|nr:hypothetical protein [Syntrophobacteraceae bacterium]